MFEVFKNLIGTVNFFQLSTEYCWISTVNITKTTQSKSESFHMSWDILYIPIITFPCWSDKTWVAPILINYSTYEIQKTKKMVSIKIVTIPHNHTGYVVMGYRCPTDQHLDTGCWPGSRFTNVFSIAIQIRWKFLFTLISILIRWSLWHFVHGTTAKLSWHVQKFVAIWWPVTELQLGEVAIEFKLWAKNR